MEGNLFINQDTLAYCVFGATFLSGGLGEQMLNRLYNNIEILTRLYNNNIEMKLTRLFQSGCKARGTTTNRVTRYSESITKCSFLTKEMDSACHPGKILCCVSLLDKKMFVVSQNLLDKISNISGDETPRLLLLYALQCIFELKTVVYSSKIKNQQ